MNSFQTDGSFTVLEFVSERRSVVGICEHRQPFSKFIQPAAATPTEKKSKSPDSRVRDCVIQSLRKSKIGFSIGRAQELRDKLAKFYAQRTLTKQPILPQDCADAIVCLLSERNEKPVAT